MDVTSSQAHPHGTVPVVSLVRPRTVAAAVPQEVVKPAEQLSVSVERRKDGGSVTRVTDPRTGDVLYEAPPENVVRIIDAALARTRLGLQLEQGEAL